MNNVEGLKVFLLTQAKTKKAKNFLIPRAIENLLPFYHMSEVDEHRLQSYPTLLAMQDELKKEVELALQNEKSRITFVEIPMIFSKEQSFFSLLQEKIGFKYVNDVLNNIRAAFDNLFWMAMEDMLWEKYSDNNWEKFKDLLL